MKSKVYVFLLTLGSCMFQISCTDFLDRNPLDRPSSGTFWKSETDFDQALTACYGSMQSQYFSYSMPIWDNLTDNSAGQQNVGVTQEVVQGNISPTTGGIVSEIYTVSYNAIARVNIFLQNLKDFTGITDKKKKQIEAEARMIRAHFYFYLYRCYGDVPVITEPVSLDNQFQPKKTAAEVLAVILDDIDYAISNLQDIPYSDSQGRWTTNAAKGYKARVLLYDAYDDSGNAIIDKMKEVKNLLSDISGYSLATDFTDNFDDLKQESSPEIMMSVKFLAPDNWHSADQFYNEWIRVAPLANFINLFEMKDGSVAPPVPYTGNGIISVDDFTNENLDEREPRAARTVFIDKYRSDGISYTPGNIRQTGAGLYKFTSSNQKAPFNYSTYSQQDWIILRYADVLLMRAEAENEINGPTKMVYADINAIRTRVGLPSLQTDLNQEEMREKIRDERRKELAFEGSRYFDLKRWRVAEQVLNKVIDGLYVYRFEKKHYLWPLPQAEIDNANGKLIQNADYE